MVYRFTGLRIGFIAFTAFTGFITHHFIGLLPFTGLSTTEASA
jgi:hypothetical protein